jgi:hypothetical protein
MEMGQSCEANAVEAVVSELDRKLARVLDPTMRTCLVREALESRQPADAYELIRAVMTRRPPARGSCFDVLRDVLLGLLLDPESAGTETLSYELRRDLYGLASAAHDLPLMRLLRSASAVEGLEVAALELPRDLADIPLGRRRSLARGDDRKLLELLALDSDVTVIENLLRNPRLRESDVLRIAARRPVADTTLAAIHRCDRWSARPGIRVALARNPYCPVDIAVKLVGSIPLPDLREMRADPDLHPETSAQVRAELERRSRPCGSE